MEYQLDTEKEDKHQDLQHCPLNYKLFLHYPNLILSDKQSSKIPVHYKPFSHSFLKAHHSSTTYIIP